MVMGYFVYPDCAEVYMILQEIMFHRSIITSTSKNKCM